jgi:hypothetical protein
MTIIVKEAFDSPKIRFFTGGQTEEQTWNIKGTADKNEATAAFLAALESEFSVAAGTMRLKEAVLGRNGGIDSWVGQVNYELAINDAGSIPEHRIVDFELGGGTAKILCSKSIVTSYPGDTGTANGAPIGATADGVEGCDVFIPSKTWSETFTFPAGTLDSAYEDAIDALLETPVNNDTFRGKPAGSVLFLGVTGRQSGLEQDALTCKFSYSKNVTGLQIGPISGITKDGWDYADLTFKEDVVANVLIKTLVKVTIHRVYDRGDFSVLSIGTAQ